MLKSEDNICQDKKPAKGSGFDNVDCIENNVFIALEQSGTDVTEGYVGGFDTQAEPITTSYFAAGLCPVNVHWHLGTEHRSAGEFDENGKGPAPHIVKDETSDATRRLGSIARLGFRCGLYDPTDEKFTKEYNWQYCTDMYVGETYEVHWPHSSMGACHTPNQYQTPFYDGVFCTFPNGLQGDPPSTQASVGVQAQIFTIVNDESYYYPDLFSGMIVDGDFGKSMTKYTGSTTGTTRNNEKCSKYTPITWQVDRKCHLISASSFDKMCSDMLDQRDDMSGDVHPHGARELVKTEFAADNHQPRM